MNGHSADEYDLVCIGAGSGGVRACRYSAANYGAKVAVVELPFGFVSSERIGGAGGTCVIRGCVPKKLLVYGSEFSEGFHDAQGFGWSRCEPTFDWNRLIDNKGKEIQRLNSVYASVLKNAGVEQIEGRAYLKDAKTVQVFDAHTDGLVRELKAKNVLIAVGASAHRLPIPGSELTITSDEALSLPKQPRNIAIIGAGYIAVEFSGIFSGLGTEVHLFYRKPHPLTGFDQECRELVAENLARRVNLHAECNPVRVEKREDGALDFTYSDAKKEEHTIVVDAVMMATGRVPKTRNLGLENAGVTMKKGGGIEVDELQRTNVPGIWALGDVTDKIQLTPVALMEGMAFATTCFGGNDKKPDYAHVPSAVFCQPPLSKVGYGEEDAINHFSGTLNVYSSKFKPMKNTLSGREERTLMKIIVHKETDKVVGIHMVGPDAAEIMQGMAIALKAGATKSTFDSTVGIHPSAAEEFVTMRSVTRTHEGKGTATP